MTERSDFWVHAQAARAERGRPTRRARVVEVVVVLAVVSVLSAVAVDRLVQLRMAARSAAFASMRAAFLTSLELTHLHWELVRSDAIPVTGGRAIHMNAKGWPTIDRAHPDQDDARELCTRLLSGPLGEGWYATAYPAKDAGRVIFTLKGQGGGSFRYDAADGSIDPVEPSPGARPESCSRF